MSSRKTGANIVNGYDASDGQIMGRRTQILRRRLFQVLDKEFSDLTIPEALATIDSVLFQLKLRAYGDVTNRD